ncbi:casein kinase II subunit alpha, chloroplastic-like [Gossypium australe]|uniref:Casein kinase II subunit alpha, chloroplastic-like n=1 Tax=Gossypium australe TaxID=47621 RepID=A0A5B6X4K1_9ROSI|nr:casein kinase II subunit alpha, chloroplastic-like [Gossypium australe]
MKRDRISVSIWKKVHLFDYKGKLSPRFIGPYESVPSHVISPTEFEIQPDMTYSEEPIKILACETKNFSESSLTTTWNRIGYLGTGGNNKKTIFEPLYW